MPKYEVPFYYTVWVEVEAENETEAWHKAAEPGSATDFDIKAKYLNSDNELCVSFLERGDESLINKLENENA